jgi:hypothetical protein
MSLIKTSWAAAQRVVHVAAHVRLVVNVTKTRSTQISIKLLARCSRKNLVLKVTGNSNHLRQQLQAIQPTAACIAVVRLTLLISQNDDKADTHMLATKLSYVLTPLTHYIGLTRLELGVVQRHQWLPATANSDTTITVVPLTGMPAVKELVLIHPNEVQTVLLVNTLCEAVVPGWQHSIEILKLYTNFSTETAPLSKLSLLNSYSIVVHKLRLPRSSEEMMTNSKFFLEAGRIELVPEPQSQIVHLYIHCPCEEEEDRLQAVFWQGVLNSIKTQELYHLHVHARGNCSHLWRALSAGYAPAHVYQLSITYEEKAEIHLSNFKHLHIALPVTIHLKQPSHSCMFGTFDTTPLAAKINVYCKAHSQEQRQCYNRIRGLFVKSQVDQYVL